MSIDAKMHFFRLRRAGMQPKVDDAVKKIGDEVRAIIAEISQEMLARQQASDAEVRVLTQEIAGVGTLTARKEKLEKIFLEFQKIYLTLQKQLSDTKNHLDAHKQHQQLLMAMLKRQKEAPFTYKENLLQVGAAICKRS